jgi:hypothetical protein
MPTGYVSHVRNFPQPPDALLEAGQPVSLHAPMPLLPNQLDGLLTGLVSKV